MGFEFWKMIFNIVIVLPFILLLIYITLKYGGGKMQRLNKGRYIKVVEKTALSKDNALLLVKIGEKPYVVSSSNGKVEVVLELSKEEIESIEKMKIQELKQVEALFNPSNLNKLYKKLIKRKDNK